MPLIKATLKTEILDALNASSNIVVNPNSETDNKTKSENARNAIAEALANAIDKFVKSGTVTTTVTTTGSASAQAGTGTGSIS